MDRCQQWHCNPLGRSKRSGLSQPTGWNKGLDGVIMGMFTDRWGPSTGDWVDLLFPGPEPPVFAPFKAGRPVEVPEAGGVAAEGTEEVAVAMGKVEEQMRRR